MAVPLEMDVTRFLLDVAIYQGKLSPAAVKAAGYTAVNLKISHGLSGKNVHPDLAGWVGQARALGLGISTFHYMTADSRGEAQAQYAYDMLVSLGLEHGTAHQLDVESNPAPALSSVRGYLTVMQARLSRPVVLYTGDWWWTARPNWNVSDLTPYLWSAPNEKYLGSYPGDTSPHWKAGYGGWPSLSVMQYAVKPLTGIDVSMSAIRDENVWTALTGGDVAAAWTLIPCLVALRTEFNTLAPGRDKGADGAIGDSSHTSSSDHTPDEISSVLRDHDADNKNEVHALDIDSSGPWPGEGTQKQRFHRIVMRVIDGERAKWKNASDRCRLGYVIWDGKVYDKDADFVPRTHTGPDPHTNHAHFSGRYETSCENDLRPWGVTGGAAAAGGDDDMTTKAEFLGWLKDGDVAKALANAVHNTDNVIPAPEGATNADGTPNTHWSGSSYLLKLYAHIVATRNAATSLPPQVAALLAYAKAEEGEVPATAEQIAELVRAELADEPIAESAPAFVALLGPAKAAALADAIRALTARS